MNHRQKSIELFKSGSNCCQAVFVAFCDIMNISEQDAYKISSSFGGGIGRMHEVCGAVSGMCMVLGMVSGFDDSATENDKVKHYETVQKLVNDFKNKNKSFICRELLVSNEEHTHEWYRDNYCINFVGDAADIMDSYIESLHITD